MKFRVETIAQSLSFYYEPVVTVEADSVEEAKEQAITKVSQKMLIHRSLIRVANVQLV